MKTSDLQKKGYSPDEEAQEAVWAHCASPSFLSAVAEMTELIDADYQPEICVTTAAEAGRFDGMGFSGVGLFLKGEVKAMFLKDIGSSYDKEDGKRKFWERDLPLLVKSYKELVSFSSNQEGWTETLIVPTEIVGIWVTKEKAAQMSEKSFVHLKKAIGNFPITIV